MFVRNISVGPQFTPPQGANTPAGSGAIYWDHIYQKFLVIDSSGNKNEFYPAQAHIDLSPAFKTALDWAWTKMQEEKELEELCKKHPGLQEAKENFELMKVLCKS